MEPEENGQKRVAIASDHAGFRAKEKVKVWLKTRGYDVSDFGTDSESSVDYQDYARPVVAAVLEGKCGCGILICGTGLGMSYSANRYAGIRAALCWSIEVAHLARAHNDANVLILPGRVNTLDPPEEILAAWMEATFSREERHIRRICGIETMSGGGD